MTDCARYCQVCRPERLLWGPYHGQQRRKSWERYRILVVPKVLRFLDLGAGGLFREWRGKGHGHRQGSWVWRVDPCNEVS
jgi:hypothetical protein